MVDLFITRELTENPELTPPVVTGFSDTRNMGKRLHEPRARAGPLRLLFLAANAAVARRPRPSLVVPSFILPVGREFCLSINLGGLIDALRPRGICLYNSLYVYICI